ncbi:MAG: hypothetical protein CSA75_01115, partial [Sorangium cellulosum]
MQSAWKNQSESMRRKPRHLRTQIRQLGAASCLTAIALSCGYDKSDRWDNFRPSTTPQCEIGEIRCATNLQLCTAFGDGAHWTTQDDCVARGQICVPSLLACANCVPSTRRCDDLAVMACSADGSEFFELEQCAGEPGSACRNGKCVDLCAEARSNKSNVGCEYWAVDLDNATINATKNAAAQQYAVVVSNPQPDLDAEVVIEKSDGEPGSNEAPTLAASAIVPPGDLRVFKLGPREVDGSPPGEFDTGAGTARTHAAYRIGSTVPVVAYQFNPLDNVNVFSNDASLLKPVEAVTSSPDRVDLQYLVLGWPQTIAHTDDPDTNFNPRAPIDLRGFMTIVGTREDTHV